MQQILALHRPIRFVSTYWWLFERHRTTHPWLFTLTIATGIIFRFSNIMALVVSMKCAVWILDPDRQLKRFAFLSGHTAIEGAVLILLPMLLVGVAIAAERAHLNLFSKLRSSVAQHLALSDVRGKLNIPAHETLDEKRIREISLFVSEKFERSFQKAHRAQTWFIQIIVALSVMMLITGVGLYIEFQIMIVILFASVPLLGAFIWRRHAQSRANLERQEQLNSDVRAAKVTFESRLRRWLQKPGSAGQWKSVASQYANLINSSTRLNEQFQATSEFILNLGQGLIISLFLLYLFLTTTHGDTSRLGSIAISLVLIRYSIAQLRIVAIGTVQMSKDYPLIVRLSKRG